MTHQKYFFDGSGAIVLGQGHSSNNPDNYNRITHVEIGGLTIQGPNQNISYTNALANRTAAANNGNNHDTQNLYHGRGIAVWAGEYVNIHNNTVYDTPNSGIRVNNTDYARIIGNTVYNTTWWSYNAESGIVMAQSYNWDDDLTDPPTKIKMRIENNLSYDNVNRLPFFNKNNACNGANRYGCSDQDYIHDGSGTYVTRNNYNNSDTSSNPNGRQYQGIMYFANNVSYGNGLNAVVIHKTDNGIAVNNTGYRNGEVPSDVSGSFSEAWWNALGSGRQDASGMVNHSSSNAHMYNNVSDARYSTDYHYRLYTSYTVTGSTWYDNLCGASSNFKKNGLMDEQQVVNLNKVTSNSTLFKNTTLGAFDLSSPAGGDAIDNGNANYSYNPFYDHNWNYRSTGGTIGSRCV